MTKKKSKGKTKKSKKSIKNEKGKGWYKESRRHALAAKGVKTGRAVKASTAYAYNYAKPRKLTQDEYEYKINKTYLNKKGINSVEEYKEMKQITEEFREERQKEEAIYYRLVAIRQKQIENEIKEIEQQKEMMREDFTQPTEIMTSQQIQAYSDSRYNLNKRKQKLIKEMKALSSEKTVIRDIDIDTIELEADIKANKKYFYPKGGI